MNPELLNVEYPLLFDVMAGEISSPRNTPPNRLRRLCAEAQYDSGDLQVIEDYSELEDYLRRNPDASNYLQSHLDLPKKTFRPKGRGTNYPLEEFTGFSKKEVDAVISELGIQGIIHRSSDYPGREVSSYVEYKNNKAQNQWSGEIRKVLMRNETGTGVGSKQSSRTALNPGHYEVHPDTLAKEASQKIVTLLGNLTYNPQIVNKIQVIVGKAIYDSIRAFRDEDSPEEWLGFDTEPLESSKTGSRTMTKKIQFGGRKANPNDMTGGGKPSVQEDMGKAGDKYTMLGVPMSGHDDALDDDQQPTGAGAPATTIPGAPLKSPMKAGDIPTPTIREGVEASIKLLRQSASEIRKLTPHLARRLMVMASDLSRKASDDLSTAELELAGDDEANDDSQDNLGHGKLEFFGTDSARKDQLTAKKAKRKATPTSWNDPNPEAQSDDQAADGVQGTGGFEGDGKKPLMDITNAKDVDLPETKKATHVLVNPKGKPVLRGSKESLQRFAEKAYNSGKIASLRGWSTKRIAALTSHKASQNPSEESTWKSLRKAFKSLGEMGGSHNGGRFAAQIHDYGKTIEIESAAKDSEGIPRTAGVVSVTLVHDAPGGRFATLEVIDGVVGNNTVQQTIKPSHVKAFAEQWMGLVAGSARELLTQ